MIAMDETSQRLLQCRRLEPADVSNLISYLEEDRANNLFLLANMDQLGFAHPDLWYYGAFDARGQLAGALMLFRRNAGAFWRDARVLPNFAEIMRREKAGAISGRRDLVDPLLTLLPTETVALRIAAGLARVTETSLRPWPERGERLAALDDLELLADLYAHNLLFSNQSLQDHRERIRAVLAAGGLITMIEREGMAVAAARTSAIGHGMAMIGGVITLPEWRRQGFAKACTGLLSRILIDRDCEPHLTYDRNEPGPRATYHGLGYQDVADWTIAFLNW